MEEQTQVTHRSWYITPGSKNMCPNRVNITKLKYIKKVILSIPKQRQYQGTIQHLFKQNTPKKSKSASFSGTQMSLPRVPPYKTPKTIPGESGSVKFLGGIEYSNPGSQNNRTSCNLADSKHSLNQ